MNTVSISSAGKGVNKLEIAIQNFISLSARIKNMKPLILIFLITHSSIISAQDNRRTLKICDLDPIDRELREVSYYDALTKQCGENIEAWSARDGNLIAPSFHPFLQAVHNAYALHRSLSISPDMIWLLIAQGFSTHVNQNPEKLRHYFVDFGGKKVLKVRRDRFIKGSNLNDWEGVFPEFTEQIGEYTGQELLSKTLLDFSTTGNAEKAAFEITLMEAMSNYFIYATYTLCGIPEIKLEGNIQDWELILSKSKELKEYDLEWWIDELIPVLEKFVEASKGQTEPEFWGQIYKTSGGSGGPFINGWILKFFPYFLVRQNYIRSTEFEKRVTTRNFPSGISKAEFYWMYGDKVFQMEFYAGFIGVKQNKISLELRPEIGWAIRDTGVQGVKAKDAEYKKDILTSPRNKRIKSP